MRVQLRRYPNRRYYDAARSQHLTLEDIFRLICEGHQVQVNDSKSGEDITVRVLAQLILEQAPEQAGGAAGGIAAPDHPLQRVVVARVRRQVFLSRLVGVHRVATRIGPLFATGPGAERRTAQDPRGALPGQSLPFLAPNWAAMMMGPFARALLAGGADPPSDRAGSGAARPSSSPTSVKAVEELKQQVAAALRTTELRTETREEVPSS